MPQCSQVVPTSFCRPLWAMTKLVKSSLIGVWALTGSPSEAAAHCSQRCFSIFLPLRISVRWTVAGLLQLSHFMERRLHLRKRRGGRPSGLRLIVFRLEFSVNVNRLQQCFGLHVI